MVAGGLVTVRMGRTAAMLAAVALGALGLSACEPSPPQVLYYGDSLAFEAEPYFNFLLQSGGHAQVIDNIYAGSALCDWMGQLRADASNPVHRDAIVLAFSGDDVTPCIEQSGPWGSFGYYQNYVDNMNTVVSEFAAAGTHVYIVGSPQNYDEYINDVPNWNELNELFAGIASEHPGQVTYVDAGSAVELDGHFTWTLPCLSFEACTGPVVDGQPSNIVRSSRDGVHFCPDNSIAPVLGLQVNCNVYSSGAFRYAMAMAAPVMRQLGF